LLEHHLLQLTGNEQIEFRHQLLQEYYAAEALLGQVAKMSDAQLKRDYLNYLKWTEPVALMLALLEDEVQAVRVVRLALEVDLMLGARLAGEVKREFQEKTVELVGQLEVREWLKVNLLEMTRSGCAVPFLARSLQDEDSYVRRTAAEALGEIGNEAAVNSLIAALQDEDSDVRRRAAKALKEIAPDRALPQMWELLLTGGYDTTEIILKIQERCQFYNIALFHSPPVEETKTTQPETSTSNTFIFNREVGILQPGEVTIQRNQTGIQHDTRDG
jgi:predicted NACHT family NTPase